MMPDGAPPPSVGELAKHGLYRSLASLEVFLLLGGLYVACNVLIAAPAMDYQNQVFALLGTEDDSAELMRKLGELDPPQYNFLLFVLSFVLMSLIAMLWLRTLSFGRESALAGGFAALVRRSAATLLRFITVTILFVAGGLLASLIVGLVGGMVGGLLSAFGLASQTGVSMLLTVLILVAIFTVMALLYVGFAISVVAASRDKSIGVLKALELAGPGRWRLFRCFVLVAALSIPAYLIVLFVAVNSASPAFWIAIFGNLVGYVVAAYGGAVAVGFYDWLEPSLPAELQPPQPT